MRKHTTHFEGCPCYSEDGFQERIRERDDFWRSRIQEVIDCNGEWIHADELTKILGLEEKKGAGKK